MFVHAEVSLSACALVLVRRWRLRMRRTKSRGIEIETGGKLRLTRGISTVEGQGGGGLTPWALITGDETDRGIGGTAHVTAVKLPDYSFLSYGVGVGLFDRFELTYTRQEFDTEDVGAALGWVRVSHSARMSGAQRCAWPATRSTIRTHGCRRSRSAQTGSRTIRAPSISAIGGSDDEGWEAYASATKILLDSSLLLNGTLRWTNANQTGLLGYGGNLNDDHELMGEFSAGWMLSRDLVDRRRVSHEAEQSRHREGRRLDRYLRRVGDQQDTSR